MTIDRQGWLRLLRRFGSPRRPKAEAGDWLWPTDHVDVRIFRPTVPDSSTIIVESKDCLRRWWAHRTPKGPRDLLHPMDSGFGH